jgi:hypothetical protein
MTMAASAGGMLKEEKEMPQLEQNRAPSLIISLHCGQVIAALSFQYHQEAITVI